MNVLVACEASQTVCSSFRKLGHRAFSCDIQDCYGGHPEWHIKEDVLNIINGSCDLCCGSCDLCYASCCHFGSRFKTQDGNYHFLPFKWDLIIAHPPCTYLTKASACRMYPKAGCIDSNRYEKALAAKDFFLKILNCNCDKICVENPIPLKVVDLPKYTQKIQPYEFGHPFSKCTCLWLKGLDCLKPTNILTEHTPYLPSNTSMYSKGRKGSKGVARSQAARSKTFSGIAEAMAFQWGM